jgi:pimeloyl-ACP methyl ester carboxylesterase
MVSSFDQKLQSWCESSGAIFATCGYARGTKAGYVDAILVRPDGRARGLIVYVHGTGNDHIYPQISLFQQLVKAGYAVFSFDLDGHGRNSSTKFDPDSIADAVECAVNAAESNIPGLPIFLIGHSLGGAAALAYLSSAERDIAGVILVSVPLHVPMAVKPFVGELRSLQSISTFVQIRNYGPWGIIPAFGPFKRGQYPVRHTKTIGRLPNSMTYVDEVQRAFEILDVSEAAKSVDAPSLLIYGERDGIAPLRHGEKLFDSLGECELFAVPKETHFSTLLSKATENKIVNWLLQH